MDPWDGGGTRIANVQPTTRSVVRVPCEKGKIVTRDKRVGAAVPSVGEYVSFSFNPTRALPASSFCLLFLLPVEFQRNHAVTSDVMPPRYPAGGRFIATFRSSYQEAGLVSGGGPEAVSRKSESSARCTANCQSSRRWVSYL